MSTPAPWEAGLLRLRSQFPILRDSTYLASHSMGAMPSGAYLWLRRYADEWCRDSLGAYEKWLPRLRETADTIGSLFGAPRGTVVFHQNVSTLMGIVLSAIVKPRARRNRVVYTDLNFPSIHYNWKRHEELGLDVTIVKSPDGIHLPLESITGALDDRTLAVVVDHGIFRSALLQDVGAIAKAARAVGAYTVVDSYQTVGCVPMDVTKWGVDFLLGGSHKWLCGGPGASYLYVRKDLIAKLHPRITGWFAQADPFAFEMAMKDAPDAMRFATGTPGLPGIHAARAGIDLVAKVGPKRIRAKSQRQMQALVALALAAGLKVNSPLDPRHRSGMVCLDFPGAERAEAALARKRIFVDYRPRCGVRVSAHFYTTDDELFSIVPELVKLRRKS